MNKNEIDKQFLYKNCLGWFYTEPQGDVSYGYWTNPNGSTSPFLPSILSHADCLKLIRSIPTGWELVIRGDHNCYQMGLYDHTHKTISFVCDCTDFKVAIEELFTKYCYKETLEI